MESVKSQPGSDMMLITNACGGGYESDHIIDGTGDNFGIEEALKKEYGEYRIKNIYN
jgi:cysteine synthase